MRWPLRNKEGFRNLFASFKMLKNVETSHQFGKFGGAVYYFGKRPTRQSTAIERLNAAGLSILVVRMMIRERFWGGLGKALNEKNLGQPISNILGQTWLSKAPTR